MAHFYGRLQGQRGEATRLGSKVSGIFSTVQTWQVTLRTSLGHDDLSGTDTLNVRFEPHNGYGKNLVTFEDVDAVASAMDDESIQRWVAQMHTLSERISARAQVIKRGKTRDRLAGERLQARRAA